MTTLRTATLAALLGLIGLPALADGLSFDLPRLEFPQAPDVTRAATSQSTTLVTPGN